MLSKARVLLSSRIAASLRPFSTEIIASPPPGRARSITSLFIGAYLLWQVALPLSYYVSGGEADERFAWRMFSTQWAFQKTCTAAIVEQVRSSSNNEPAVREIDLPRTLNALWVKVLSRNRPAAVDKFLRGRCQADSSVTEVQFVQLCRMGEDRAVLSARRRLICSTGAFSNARASP